MSDPETQPVVESVVEEKKPDKKLKNVQQLAEARIKNAQKRKEQEEERQADKKRLAELEARLTQSALAKKEADEDTEPDDPPPKQIVTKQPPVTENDEDSSPSFANEVKKVALMGALSLASFLVAKKFKNQLLHLQKDPRRNKRTVSSRRLQRGTHHSLSLSPNRKPLLAVRGFLDKIKNV